MAPLRLAILALLLAFSAAASASASPLRRPRPATAASRRHGNAALTENNVDEDEFELPSTGTEVEKQHQKQKKASATWKKERISVVRKGQESSADRDANGDESNANSDEDHDITAKLEARGRHSHIHREFEKEEEEKAVSSEASEEETSEKFRGRNGYRHREVEEKNVKAVSSKDSEEENSDKLKVDSAEDWEKKIVSSDKLDEKVNSSDDDLIETKEENGRPLLQSKKVKASAGGSSATKRKPLKLALAQEENKNKEEKQDGKEEEERGQKARKPSKLADKEAPRVEVVVEKAAKEFGEKGDSLADTQADVPAGFEIAANAGADSADDVVGADMDDLVADHNMLDAPILDWDEQRQRWLEEHPEVGPTMDDGRERLFILTGTQPWPCANPSGDHLLLRCFKNKVDYSRIHRIDMFYNVALLDPHMPSFWAKLPVVRATMLAHPEVEWIWWLDADAIITDMEFEIPLHRYKDYNMVVHGWESLIFEKRSWLGLNAGSFLLRNCQWSMDLLERWASMGPQGPMGEAYRDILSDFLPDRPRNPTDDQAALVYLMVKEKDRWATKLRVELDFYLSGYWLELMDTFEVTEAKYQAMEAAHPDLRGMVAGGHVSKERFVRRFGRAREGHLRGVSAQERRPFITHFTGCQPCSGHHNPIYTADQCHVGLIRALNYADDQILRALGFQHRSLNIPDVHVRPLTHSHHPSE